MEVLVAFQIEEEDGKRRTREAKNQKRKPSWQRDGGTRAKKQKKKKCHMASPPRV